MILAFALVNGVNDGGTIVATGLRASRRYAWTRVVVLVVLLGATPLVTTTVARTLAERLVMFEGEIGTTAVLVAVGACLAVVWVLSSAGVPTSLTLGLIGGLTGAGLTSGLPVDWTMIGVVLAIGVAAPVCGVVVALLLARGLLPLLGRRARRGLGVAGQALTSVAYGANDGQKLLAVAAVATGSSVTTGGVGWLLWAGMLAAFALGTLIGVVRIGPTVDTRVMPLHGDPVAVAQLAGAGSVLASAALASPVSLVQSVTAGLVGAGASVTARRVRWAVVVRMLLAWVVTLPASFAAAAVVAAAVRALT